MRDSGGGQMGYWRRKASEWFRVISRAYESFPRVPPLLPLMGMKKIHNKAMQWPHPTTVLSRLWHFLRHPHWRTQCGGRSCRTLLPIPRFETKSSSSASAFQELGQQIICCFLQTEHFLRFFLNLVTQQRDAHLGRNDLSGPTAARLGSSLEEKQYFLLLWQPQAKQFLIGWKRHSSSAYGEKHEDLKKKK